MRGMVRRRRRGENRTVLELGQGEDLPVASQGGFPQVLPRDVRVSTELQGEANDLNVAFVDGGTEEGGPGEARTREDTALAGEEVGREGEGGEDGEEREKGSGCE